MSNVHRVQQGECLSSIAKKYGFSDWKKIYDHPQNDGVKQKRKNPNILFLGDKIFIPDKELKEESCGTESEHRFKVKAQFTLLRLVLKDEEDQPFSGKKYKLELEDKTYENTTGGDGLIEHKIPADVERAYLTVWMDDNDAVGTRWPLDIGHLDPVEEISGVQARLNNLGFDCGQVDGILGPKTKAALEEFQAKYGLAVTGEANEAIRNKLAQLHDGT